MTNEFMVASEELRSFASAYLDAVAETSTPPSPRESGIGDSPSTLHADNHPSPRRVGNALKAAKIIEPPERRLEFVFQTSSKMGRAHESQA
jgi:hypothetical protein